MTFQSEIEKHYEHHGKRHMMPFIGATYTRAEVHAFRVAAVGLNAYVEDPAGQDAGDFRKWWGNAGQGKKWPETALFFDRGYAAVQQLAIALRDSPLFQGLSYDESPITKSSLYATDAIKIYTSPEMIKASNIPPDFVGRFAPTWHGELDSMARHDVFPHLIVGFGQRAMETLWQAFNCGWPDVFPEYRVLKVTKCDMAKENDPSHHFAARICVETSSGAHESLFVRVGHPTRPASDLTKNAEWLLAQPEFRKLAELGKD